MFSPSLSLHVPGTTGEQIVFAGDSAGGTFVITASMKLKELGLRLPDRILSCYPSTITRTSASPSRFMTLVDPILPIGILLSCQQVHTLYTVHVCLYICIHENLSSLRTIKLSWRTCVEYPLSFSPPTTHPPPLSSPSVYMYLPLPPTKAPPTLSLPRKAPPTLSSFQSPSLLPPSSPPPSFLPPSLPPPSSPPSLPSSFLSPFPPSFLLPPRPPSIPVYVAHSLNLCTSVV